MIHASLSVMLRVFLTAALAVTLTAQAPARKPASKKTPPTVKSEASPQSWPLSSLNVTGNHNSPEKAIVAASGLKLGELASKAQFEAARERLIATGAFETVGYKFGPDRDGKGISGTFEVVEVEQLFPYRFERLPVSEGQLRTFLKEKEPLFGSKLPGTKEFLTRIAKEVEEFAVSKGLKDGVIATVESDGPNEMSVVFRPAAPPARVGDIRFTGNEVLSSAQLNTAFNLVAVGTPYTDHSVRMLLDSSIRPLYEARGRMRVAFPKIEAKEMKTADGVALTITVDEGPSFNFGKIKVTANGLSESQLLRAANLKSGDPANMDLARAGVEAIQKEFRSSGFMRSETAYERSIHDQDKTVDIQYKSVSGVQFLMGKLNIEGLDVVSEPAIRKLWSRAAGKPYDHDYPRYFLDRVKEDGYLENVKSTHFTERINEVERTVDVTLVFIGGVDKEEQEKRRKRERPDQP